MSDPRPWTNPGALATQLAGWRQLWAGRSLFRVTAGQDWIRLHIEGDARPGIILTSLPAASLVFAHDGQLPEPVAQALPAARNHSLSGLLESAGFSSCGMFPADQVAAFRLSRPDGGFIYLIHQLFGARGNTVLLDEQAKLLWARRRPPHSLLAAVPPLETWTHSQPETSGDKISGPALEYLANRLLEKSTQETSAGLSRRLKSARRLVANLDRDLDQAAQGDFFRRQAEALAANLHRVPPGAESVEVTDPRNGESLLISLDPALPPAANMETWFRRARKADKGRNIIAERLTDAQVELTSLENAMEGFQKTVGAAGPVLDNLGGLQAWRSNHQDLFPKKVAGRAAGRYGPEEPARPFRRYLVDDRWEIWVGRNNRENDELTHRAAHSKDIWLHAQGVPGSHVILRTGGHPEKVPRTVLAKAASLAALNSRARHSAQVPVIHTERRYVRKPRKAPAGTAVCLREKSVFVAPGIPPGVVGI